MVKWSVGVREKKLSPSPGVWGFPEQGSFQFPNQPITCIPGGEPLGHMNLLSWASPTLVLRNPKTKPLCPA